jgi:hypothetical protein
MIHSISSRLYGNVLENKGLHVHLPPIYCAMTQQLSGSSRGRAGAQACMTCSNSCPVEAGGAYAPKFSERFTTVFGARRVCSRASDKTGKCQSIHVASRQLASVQQQGLAMCGDPPNKAIFERNFNDNEQIADRRSL